MFKKILFVLSASFLFTLNVSSVMSLLVIIIRNVVYLMNEITVTTTLRSAVPSVAYPKLAAAPKLHRPVVVGVGVGVGKNVPPRKIALQGLTPTGIK